MKKFVFPLILLLLPLNVYALDLDRALGKIAEIQEKEGDNSSSKLMKKVSGNIKEDAFKQINDVKRQVLQEVGQVRNSIDEVKEKANSSLDKINNISSKVEQYEDLANKYLFYLKLATYAILVLITLVIILLFLLYRKVTKFQKKMVEAVVDKALG